MTSRLAAVVLYEDQLATSDPSDFGLHQLVLACVADRLERSIHDLKPLVKGIPTKGNANVLRSLRLADQLGRGGWVLGVLDEDRIRVQPEVKLPKGADEDTVVARILDITGSSSRRSIVLLVSNMESVVQAAAHCQSGLDADTVDKALAKKLNERDIVLRKAAFAPASVRDCIRGQVPSLDLLRDRLICALGGLT